MSEQNNPHSGHRCRLRQQFLENGLDGLSDINALELLLFYALPRRDTNPIAHSLLEEFGSLAGVMEASQDDLRSRGNLSENSAALLRLVMALARRAQISKNEQMRTLTDSRQYSAYLIPYFFGLTEEVVYVLALDGRCRILGCRQLFSGSISAAAVSIRSVAEYALRLGASSVVLAHNHTSGISVPSREDIETTRVLADALYAVDVLLADHVVVAGELYTSMVEEGLYTPPVLR